MRTIARLAMYLLLAVASNAGESGASRSFEGVIATFRIVTPVVKHGDNLKVVTIYQNTSWKTVRFAFMEPSHFANIFRKGKRDPVTPYYIGTPAVWDRTLKPSERVELEEEVYLKAAWENLSPGDYEIQFCYHVGVLPEEIQGKYLKEYPHNGYVVPWSDHRYPFTIVK